MILILRILALVCSPQLSSAGYRDDANRLIHKLLAQYTKEARPVEDPSDVLNVSFDVQLQQILDIEEKDQILTSSLWLKMVWLDKALHWEPAEFGNITAVRLPSQELWLPDIVMSNNVVGFPQITIFTHVTVNYTGDVEWNPPGIYKSFCEMDVIWFPYDQQECELKFMLWSYDMSKVSLNFDNNKSAESIEPSDQEPDASNVKMWRNDAGLGMQNYARSASWDILGSSAIRHQKTYYGTYYCDITYYVRLRRKTVFYTVNLTVPCVLIAVMVITVFYLPAHAQEKMTLSVSILVTIAMLFLLLVEIIPPTSLAIAMIGKILLFIMVLSSASVAVTIGQLNLFYKEGFHEPLNQLTKKIMFDYVARCLRVDKPVVADGGSQSSGSQETVLMTPFDVDYGSQVSRVPILRSVKLEPCVHMLRTPGQDYGIVTSYFKLTGILIAYVMYQQ